MAELFLRFVVGGLVVSTFAVVGDLFQPKSFGGLFGAAPSVALATLALAVSKDGAAYAAIEARSMLVGAAAFFVYATVVRWFLRRRRLSALKSSLAGLPVWFAVAFAGWYSFLR